MTDDIDDDSGDGNVAVSPGHSEPEPQTDADVDPKAAVEAWKRKRAAGQMASTVAVEMVSAEEPPASGFGAKLRGFIAGGAASSDDDSDTPRRGRRPSVKADDVAAGIVVPLLAIAFLAVPPHVRMRQDEMHATALPLARILLRRIRALRRMSPDVIDIFAIIAAITVYVRRLQVEAMARQQQQRAAMEEQRRAASGTQQQRAASPNGFNPYASSDPLAAYLSGNGG